MQKDVVDSKNAQVASAHIECTSGCVDPTTADTNWRYQDWFLEDIEVSQHQRQMSFLSNNEAELRNKFNSYYFFDVSAGEDIPVYVPDTGAQMDHPVSLEFLQRAPCAFAS